MRHPSRSLLIVQVILCSCAFVQAQEEPQSKKVGELTYSGVVFPMRRVTMQPNLVTSQQSARVSKVLFQEGDMVKQGQLLVQLDNREPALTVGIFEQQVEQDLQTIGRLKRQLEYQEIYLKGIIEMGVSGTKFQTDKAQYDYDDAKLQIDQSQVKLASDKLQVEMAKTRLEDYEIRAPFEGVISLKAVEEGQSVENTTRVLELMEVSSVLVYVNVENEYFHGIQEGDKVTVTVETLPGRTFEAVVHRRAPIADPRSKTFKVEIKIDNKDNAVKPGWYADVVFPPKVAAAKATK
jgi:RND family efflux transporter MFP subunit